MLSNRESARRSRRRKQEHLQKMEDELRRAHDERDAANKRVEQLQKQLDAKRMKCEELESENARLVQHLQALGALPQKRPAPGLEQADARAKKARRSKQSTPEVQQDDGTVQV
ncbi:unnamed protein product [Pedinophyceae sp. YPF-701]|nr:unnamed protein product [Pedinophyceae sp. YPF-701]